MRIVMFFVKIRIIQINQKSEPITNWYKVRIFTVWERRTIEIFYFEYTNYIHKQVSYYAIIYSICALFILANCNSNSYLGPNCTVSSLSKNFITFFW